MKESKESITVGEIVAQDFRKAEVFKRFGIDFCCGGNIPLNQACTEKNIDIQEVQKELDAVDMKIVKDTPDFNDWELDKLIDYIVDEYHVYVNETGPKVRESVNRVKKVHGPNKPNVTEISDRFDDLLQELDTHMHKEEIILFPHIKQMLHAQKSGLTITAPFGTVQNPINMMLSEHNDAGNELEIIQQLTHDYKPPADACSTHQVSYLELKNFADNLMEHIHLENNILFPKALALEKKMREN